VVAWFLAAHQEHCPSLLQASSVLLPHVEEEQVEELEVEEQALLLVA